MSEAKAFRGQYEDEEVQLVFRKHPVVMRKGLILFMFALLLGSLPSYLPNADLNYFYFGLAGGFVLGLLLMFPSWIYWYFSVNIMTDQRFIQIIQKGFFKKRYSDIGIHQIQSVNFQVVGIQETLLGFGTIVIQTYLGDVVIHDVHKPQEISSSLSKVIREHGSAAPPDTEDIAQRVSHERRAE